MARGPGQSRAPTRVRQHGRSGGRFAAAVAAVAAVALVGCGSGSAEPKEKDWDEGDQKQSQQQSSGDGQDDQKSDDQKKSGDGDDDVVREGDEDGPDAGTKKQAEQLIADYLDAQNAATKDGDFSRVDPMVDECQICSTSKSNITEVYDNGGKVEGSLFTKPEVTAGQERDGKVNVTVVSTISAYTVTDGSGKEIDSGPAEKQTYQYSVAKQEGEWKIVSGRFVE